MNKALLWFYDVSRVTTVEPLGVRISGLVELGTTLLFLVFKQTYTSKKRLEPANYEFTNHTT